MARENVAVKARAVNGTAIHIARGGVYMGCIVISDVIKENAPGMLRAIKALGVEKTVMLTGDGAPAAKAAAEALGIDLYYFGLLPQEKVAKIEDLLAQKNKKAGLSSSATASMTRPCSRARTWASQWGRSGRTRPSRRRTSC
jgi:Cd2+/Zn2+-exporting ATPase